ncbi:MAG: FAD-dependent oxidoreductase [Pseudomonadota bacterium]
MRDERYDILFEPVKIGPVTARNRFYQVPHCNGMGSRYPQSLAAMRGVKAEGGWGVVCTEEAEIHHTSDLSPYLEGRIWDESDIPSLARMVEAVHTHGSLAGIELVHGGHNGSNRYSREVTMTASDMTLEGYEPSQARAMDKQDIANVRRWHVQAALRSKAAGFDIIYVYAGHDLTIFQHFLSRRHNHRTDEYGGSLENRLRFFREVLEDTREAVGDTCAVAVRFAVDELLDEDGINFQGEGRDAVAMLAELPDLWDVNISAWPNDSQTARFAEEGYQEQYIKFVKSLTSKPVVGVGRYTSPDAMVRVIKEGVMDMIGAARPSIADPFLPKKIEEGRIEDIRECIGCNICVSADYDMVPLRCTQNPTMGEEWRREWHPEVIPSSESSEQVLIVGGGPAGLEAARALGQRGVSVALAEKTEEWGGRCLKESSLPGMSSYKRVSDWRIGQLQTMPNVGLYLASEMTADDIIEYGVQHVVLATGSSWRKDGVGRSSHKPLPGIDDGLLLTPEQVIAGERPQTNMPVIVYDDDPYIMGGLVADLLAGAGYEVMLVTPFPMVSPWTENTMEQHRIQKRLLTLGVKIHPNRQAVQRLGGALEVACTYSGAAEMLACGALIPVTSRLPEKTVANELEERRGDWKAAGISSVTRIGDCNAPGLVATAVYAGHRYAREFGESINPDVPPFKREMIQLD